MRSIFIAALAAASFAVSAETLVGRQGDDWVRLTDKPCTNKEVIAKLGDPKFAQLFRSATAQFQGQHFSACWRMAGSGAYLVYQDGDQGFVPSSELKPELSI